MNYQLIPLQKFIDKINDNDNIFNGTKFENWIAIQNKSLQDIWQTKHQNLFGIKTTREWLNELKDQGYVNIGLDVVLEILNRNYEGFYDANATHPDEGSYILSNHEVKEAFKKGLKILEKTEVNHD